MMVSAPAVALASVIAWRSEPTPKSFVFVTVKVAAWAGRVELARSVHDIATTASATRALRVVFVLRILAIPLVLFSPGR
ncbi:MAG: hypothetical protein H0V83_03965, partial [Rubrobacter sp.]|nr:hypothetical protein [Rubrobacter sp.]